VSSKLWAPSVSKFDENEERDDHGRWVSGENQNPSFQQITKGMTRVKEGMPLGSNGGRWYKSDDGKMFLIKPATSAAQAYNEVAAGAVYREAGAPFPHTSVGQSPSGKYYVISQRVDGLEQHTSDWWKAHPETQAAAAKDFGVDALLSHWDVHGAGGDNTLVASDGTPVRIESGGAMSFRAMGAYKPEFSPTNDWTEVNSLRTGEQGLRMFGNMTDAQAADSLEAAGKIDLDAVRERWTQIGVPPLMSETWIQTLEARQAQIPSIVAALRATAKMWRPRVLKFDEGEERDDHGRWTKSDGPTTAAAANLKAGDVIHAGGLDHQVLSASEHENGMIHLKYDDGGGQKELLVPKDATYSVTHAPPPPPPPPPMVSADSVGEFLDKIHSGQIIHGEVNRAELSAVTKAMTKDELGRVQSYKGGSSAINSYLRQGKTNEPSYEKYATTLESGLDRRVGRQDQKTFIVNRGADENSLHLNGEAIGKTISASQVVPGMIFRDRGFQSTSIGHGFGGSVRWHLTVPPDVPAAYVGITDGFKGEREVVLGKNLAMICTGVQQAGNETHIWATVIPPALDDILTGSSQPGSGMSSVPSDVLSAFTPTHLRTLQAALRSVSTQDRASR
jgi:ADP-ribosyltransferase exoenzyme